MGDGKRGPAASPAKRVAVGEEEDSPQGGEMSAKPTERGRGDGANEPCRLRSGRTIRSPRRRKAPPEASFLSYTGEAHSFFSTRPKRKNGGRKSAGPWASTNVWS